MALGVLWAAGALAWQVLAARGGGRRDYSQRAGDPSRGILYNFTIAMQPAHKESVKNHPIEFATGLVLHAGVLTTLVGVVLLLVWPSGGLWLLALMRPLAALALLAGLCLLVRRVWSLTLRAMSVGDDYLAIAACCGLLAWVVAGQLGGQNQPGFLIYAGLLLLYLPLGKLRHAVFFFVARADLGRRLGYRGVYPPAPAETE